MQKIILFFILGLYSLASNSQALPDIKWMDQSNRQERKTSDRLLVGFTESKIYFAERVITAKRAIRQKDWMAGGYDLVTYDRTSLKEMSRELLELKHKEESLQIIEIQNIRDKTIFFMTLDDSKKKKLFLFAETFDMKELKFIDNRKMVFEKNAQGLSGDEYAINIKKSPDKTKFLISSTIKVKSKENVKTKVSVIDSDLNLLWTKSVRLSSLKKYTDLSDFGVTNQGDVFFTAQIKIKKKGSRKEFGYKQKLYLYKNKGTEKIAHTLRIKKTKWLSNAGMIWSANDESLLYLVPYATRKKNGATNFLIAHIDANTGEIGRSKDYEFPIEWTTEGRGKRATQRIVDNIEKNKFKYHKNLRLKEVITNGKTGESTVFIEDFLLAWRTASSSGTLKNYAVYSYNEIIVLQLSKDGELIWQNSINKLQESTSTSYLSYLPIVNSGNCYVLFNDSKYNIKKRAEHKKGSIVGLNKPKSKKQDIVISIFDKQGERHDKIAKSVDPFTLIYPNKYFKITDDEFIIFGKNKSTRAMGKLTFKN